MKRAGRWVVTRKLRTALQRRVALQRHRYPRGFWSSSAMAVWYLCCKVRHRQARTAAFSSFPLLPHLRKMDVSFFPAIVRGIELDEIGGKS